MKTFWNWMSRGRMKSNKRKKSNWGTKETHDAGNGKGIFLTWGGIISFCGEGDGNPLQCSCLENPLDRGAWQAIAYGVAKSRTRPSNFTCTSFWGTRPKPRTVHEGCSSHLECNPGLLWYLWWERKSCYPGMTGSFCQERGQNWMSEIAAGPPCPIADDPSALPTPTFSISSSQYLFLHILSVPAPVCQLLYCTTLLLRYCTVRLKHFFIFCVCWLFNVLFAGNVV